MTEKRLTAPAAPPITVLHIVDPGAAWVADTVGDESTIGKTMCGIPMKTSENWLWLEQLEGERICPRCDGSGFGFEPEQETLC